MTNPTSKHEDFVDEIKKEAHNKVEGKLFRYGNSSNSRSIKHGVNVTDAKKIVDWSIRKLATKLDEVETKSYANGYEDCLIGKAPKHTLKDKKENHDKNSNSI